MRTGLIVAALAAFAGQAAAQAPMPPAPEALVDRYMAALPQNLDAINRGRGEDEVARLLQVNPGGAEADVRAAVDAWQACFSGMLNANTEGAIRAAVRAMGAEKLTRLIRFYTGPDHAAFGAIVEADERGEMTDAHRADRQRIYDTYPVLEFSESFNAALDRARSDETFQQEARRCRGIEVALLERRGLRLQ